MLSVSVRSEISGTTKDFPVGYGLLVLINTSAGNVALYILLSGTVYTVHDSGVNATVEKVSEYVTRITKNNPANRVLVSFLAYHTNV